MRPAKSPHSATFRPCCSKSVRAASIAGCAVRGCRTSSTRSDGCVVSKPEACEAKDVGAFFAALLTRVHAQAFRA